MRKARREYLKKYGGVGQEPIDPDTLGAMHRAEAKQRGSIFSTKMMGSGLAVAQGVKTGLAAADFATKAGAIAAGLGVNLPGPISSTLSDFSAGLAGIEGAGQAFEKSKALSMALAMTGQKIAGEDVAKIAKGLYWSSTHDAWVKRESSLNRTKMAAEGTLQLGKAIFAESFGIR